MTAAGSRLTIDVALDGSGSVISGEIREQGVPARPFQGWLEMINELELRRAAIAAVGMGTAGAGTGAQGGPVAAESREAQGG